MSRSSLFYISKLCPLFYFYSHHLITRYYVYTFFSVLPISITTSAVLRITSLYKATKPSQLNFISFSYFVYNLCHSFTASNAFICFLFSIVTLQICLIFLSPLHHHINFLFVLFCPLSYF